MFFFKYLWTFSWRRPLSYRNQSIDLFRKSIDWFLMITASVMKELKWGKMKKNVESNIFFEVEKYYFAFESRLIFFFKMVIFATWFRRCPTLWKSTVKMTTLFWRCLMLFSSTLKNTTLFRRCSTLEFQRWHTQRCFNVDLTLCDVPTSYQPKNNVEPTLKSSVSYFFVLFSTQCHLYSVRKFI